MKLSTDGQHSFNVIRQDDLANGSGNQIRYQQEADEAFLLIANNILKSYILPNLDFR